MFTKGKTPEAPPPPVAPKPIIPEVAAPKRGTTVSRAGPSIISADVKIVGHVSSQGELDINGTIEGDVRATALTIGETGAVKGEVIAESVVVRGTIEGRMMPMLDISRTARHTMLRAAVAQAAVLRGGDPPLDRPAPHSVAITVSSPW